MLDWLRNLILGKEGYKAIQRLPGLIDKFEKVPSVPQSPKKSLVSIENKLNAQKYANLKYQVDRFESYLRNQGIIKDEPTGNGEEEEGFSLERLLNDPRIQDKIVEYVQDPSKLQELRGKITERGEEQDWV